MNNLDWISKWSSYTPDKTAVNSLDTGQSYTFSKLDEEAVRIASYLQNRYNLKKGERIAVLSEHSPEYLMLFIAAQRLGLILVPLNYRAAVYELKYCINDVAPSLIIADTNRFPKLTAELQSQLSSPLVAAGDFYKKAGRLRLSPRKPVFEIEEDQPLFIFYTSGTTGKPKGVVYTNRMMFWNNLNTTVQLEITSRDHTINALPPYHTSGWNVLLLPMLHRGARVDFTSKFKPRKILEYIQNEPISLFLAVPTMLKMMIRNKAFKNFKPKKLKYIVVGGESLTTAVIDSWAEKGVFLSQGYGLTEAGPSLTSLHYHDALWKRGSIGKPNFYVEIKIINANGDEVGIDEPGELCVSGNIVTPGYWNNSVASMEKIRDGWLCTGDIARQDKDGYLYIVGRKNQLYISGGENIYPSEIEKVLYMYDAIVEAAVVGVEHEDWGETGIAFVVVKDEDTGPAGLMEHLGRYLASYKVPKEVIYMNSLPKTGIGKVDRQTLKELYKNRRHEQRNII